MINILVCVSGGGTNLEAIFKALEAGKIKNAKITSVISNNPNAYALERARNHGVLGAGVSPKDYSDREEFNRALLNEIKKSNPDLIVLAGFLVNVPASIIREYKNRIINIHPSLIPSFCGKGFYGLKVHEGVLNRGVKVTGATVHFVDEGIDTGKILAQKAVCVQEGDTPEILQKRVMEEAEWIILPDTISKIANGEIKIGE